jgi:hypothetical protein
MKKWIQTWASYYSHLTRNLSAEQTHKLLDEERVANENIITRAKERIQGVTLYYDQSHLNDPHPPGEKKRGDKSHSNDVKVHTRELSDREI